MHLHQVLTGAVNPGDNCYSVGSVEDTPFTAYGSGCDIVILANDFECVQIIPGAKHGNIQVSCVECSQQGRIAASYGNAVCIFEPLGVNSHKRNCQLKCQWLKTGHFFLSSMTFNLAWDPQGNWLLTATDYLQLWAPPSSNILEEEEEEEEDDPDIDLKDDKIYPVLNNWKCVWHCKTAVSVHLMEWSPDGEYFATAGKDDCLLKVWYPMTGWKSSLLPQEAGEPRKTSMSVHFAFVYLAHPRAVTGFSWRNTSKFMPRGSVCNVLLTSCHDGICRLWAETLLPEDSLLGEQICETSTSSIGSNSSFSRSGRHKDNIQHALETIHHLKNLRKGQRRSSVLITHTEDLPNQLGTHEVQRHISHHANALCHFHIAASINPNTDIPPALVKTAFNLDEGNEGFVVHWLNNKEFHFTSSTEIFMQHLRELTDLEMKKIEDVDDGEREEEKERERGLLMKLDHELSLDRESETGTGTGSSEHEDGEREGSPKILSPAASPMPLPTVLLDRKIELLLKEWNKNPDMLFTIHPIDGTFLVWHVKYLDEYNPGIFRQVQVSFSSQIPVAFPSGDASSLSKNIMMYACTTSAKERSDALLQKRTSISGSLSGWRPSCAQDSCNVNIMTPTVMMVSKHIDGSLNQWAVSFADKSAFTTVHTVTHKFRYCGHRFHLNDLACHSVLPLLLTSSHHNTLRTPESDQPWDSDALNKMMDPMKHLKGSSKQQLRNAATLTFHDPNAIYSELILWRVDPIGPLSYTGGVSELARINSLHTSAFSNVAWLPTLIPSYCLGTYCNSASACFVASDGKNLRLYQAVVDARKLLDELSDPGSSKLIGEVFNIVSQQSTARPGCIIELDVITDQCGSNTQLLHVFQEDFILGYKPHKEEVELKETEIFFQPSKGYRPPPFSEKFYLIVIEKDTNGCSILHMWHLHLKSVQACVAKPTEVQSSGNQLGVPGQQTVDSSPDTSPGTTPMPRSSSVANLQTASKLILSSNLVYSHPLDIPVGIEVVRATPSAGHLSSSSIYPVCLAPYLLVTSCSDDKVRFWRCSVEAVMDSRGETKETYHWKKWPLMNDEREDDSSTVAIAGRPVAVSCSYTGRLAVAYKQPVQHNGFVSKEFSMHVCIFECESTGGSEWVLEQTIHLDDLITVESVLDSRVSVDSNLFVYSKMDVFLNKDRYLMPNTKHLVHLDWVSKEDGSHILTVGVGANIFMYGRLSGIVTEQTSSKDGVAVITLPLGGSIKQGIKSKWVLLRSIDLVSSVDGTPSLPVSLSWVRDGILVVGMDCEMHVYAQWKHAMKSGDSENDGFLGEDSPMQDPLKTSLLAKKNGIIDGAGIVDDVFGTPTVIQDGGLFEAAHVLSPTLPQYHPTQLLELMDLGKVRRAKAILSHLVKCIAGEVAIVKDPESAGSGSKRHLSRTISVSGSTAKDAVSTGKDGTRDYTEIDSIPPLPLHALLAADQDTTYKTEEAMTRPKGSDDHAKRKPEDHYSDLFQIQQVTTDDFTDFEPERRERKSKVINLSQYGPTYFGREHASVLSSHLMHSSLPGLTRLEQMFLVALADTVATTSTELDENRDKHYSGRDTLDECGLRYLLAMRLHTCLLTSLPPLYRVQLLHQGVSTCHFAWAFHSEAEEELINTIPAIQRGDPQWSELRTVGIGWWVRNINTLRRCMEKVAKAAFQRNNDALDAALFYLAMKKKAVVWGLFRSQHDEKMTQFFSHNFSEDRWRKAALKNAFALLGKQRFEQSAAFFLLAGSLKDAIEVCLEKMEDIQLAMVIARLYESEFEVSSTYTAILYEKVLGCEKDGTGFSCSKLHPDPFLRSLAYWVMKEYSRALDTLLEQTPKEDDEKPVIVKSCNPVVFSFYNYLRTHPLLIRRNFCLPDGTFATLGLQAEKSFVDKINLIERKLFFTTANAHFKVGCPVLALEVLSKLPKISIKSNIFIKKEEAGTSPTMQNGVKLEPKTLGEGIAVDRLQTVEGSSDLTNQMESSALIDWSQPAITFEDEPLNLDWEEDKHSSQEEEDGLLMKASKEEPENVMQDGKSPSEDAVADDTEVDVIAEQLKFRACLKILMTELRTLATGYEVDGGKLRFQLYNWLEKEIAALHEICNHEARDKDYCKIDVKINGDLLDHERGDKTDIGSYERHQIERRRLQAKREHAERRKYWLQNNQALLRVFLSYCSLHGAQGGGLASVRMELKFLLQESQQETTVKQLQSPLPLPTTLPLLSASIASTKTVIANPVLYLNNHIHDILHTIVQMRTPPHPNVEDVKVHTLYSLAASLSASIYQALCDSHSYSQTETNQFTGMVYQGLLLSDRRRLRTESIEEHATPNSLPAQWPGVSSLINLLNTAQDEDQPKLNVLLCEAIVAVYLSLLIHALATNACNELFRLAAHPLNNRMWAAVFGGGVKLVIKPRRQSENIPDKPQCLTTNTEKVVSLKSPHPLHQPTVSNINEIAAGCDPKYLCQKDVADPVSDDTKDVNEAPPVPSEEMDKHRRRFNMRMLVPGRPVKDSVVPPPVPAERPSYKEKFIPPELSMLDYFVAKPFLPFSDSGVIYDSDESIHSEDEDEDAFLSDMQILEHKDANSYSWALIHLVMVKLALNNIKNFFPITGLEISDLPVTSPLGIAVIKNLENWEQILQERMDQFEGPPPNYINTCFPEFGTGAGAAAARIKAMVDPENTPFKSKDYSALPAKRLWHFLVKQELLQDTFIRYMFTKKRKQSESVEDREKQVTQNSIAEDYKHKVEAELGYPGGRAKIIHKESDMIMAFAVNKANINEIVLASTHDVQELDVSALLAAQPYIWIGEEYDRESRSSDDIDFRGSTTTLTQSSTASFAVAQMQPVSSLSASSMPWFGSGQTSTGAGVLIKRNLNNVKRMTSHPVHQYYLTGAQDGSVRMFEWTRPQQLVCFRQAGNARVTRMYFNSQGNKCGVADGEGFLSIWQVNQTATNPKPYLSWQCHSKTTSDFAFITSSSLLATSGQSNDNRNVCLWDTLVSPSNSLIHAFTCHDHGATVLQYAPKHQLLITGGRKGCISIFDIRQRQALHTFQAHDSSIKALALDSSEECFCTGSAEGNVKVWRLTGYGLIHSFKHEHAKQSIFRNLSTGVMQIEMAQGSRIFSCGADGTLKMRVLPNAFNIPSSLCDVL
ncbi:dmX-like protein 2 isoform X2 [Rhineura floridana]|uniref:dmX-like protein 2 isoform X2 n=1 Tax=Rhineura floridana TaxID=261503 RepID=UPI002AC836EE|nr:dmX-like protein 2 isoform X2 [Rhineura floridana]